MKQKRKLPNWIEGDDLAIKISTSPIILDHLSKRLGNSYNILLELCSGVGIGLIYLEKNFNRLFGVEIDSKIVKSAKRNIKNPGLDNKISIINANVENVLEYRKIEPDVVIYDIPFWSDHGEGLLKKNPDLKNMFIKINQHLSNNIIIYSPIYYDYAYYRDLLDTELELEKIYINNKYDRNILYFGDLKKFSGVSEIFLSSK